MSPIPKPPRAKPPDGPLTKAWKEWQEQEKRGQRAVSLLQNQTVTYGGRSLAGVSWDEQHSMDRTALERQLEDSLWAMATLHAQVFTQEELYAAHVGAGHMEDDWYVKRLNGQNEVFLLCKCRMILVLSRCRYEGHTGQCEEPAFPIEGTWKADNRCGRHMHIVENGSE
jgi:hypothetical protein